MHAKGILHNLHVLVTRPQPQADVLVELLVAEGAHVIRFPVVEIREPRDPDALVQLINRLAEFDMAIFVSANSVRKAMPLVLAAGGLPRKLMVACVGPGTAAVLAQSGYKPHVPAARYDTEALLQLPALEHVRGKNIAIFRAESGRELLRETLIERGARVSYATCYRRVQPDVDATPLLERWERGEVHVVTLTSEEGLHNLRRLLGPAGQDLLRATPTVVISQRLAQACRAVGMKSLLIAAEASDAAILDSIKTWRKSQISL